MNPGRNRSSIIYLLLFVAIIAMVVYNFQQQTTTQEPMSINELAAAIQRGDVERIVEDDNRLEVVFKEGGTENVSHKEGNATLVEQLKDGGIILIPVGSSYFSDLIRGTRRRDKLSKENFGGCAFVPLRGKYGV